LSDFLTILARSATQAAAMMWRLKPFAGQPQ
jgi:hypothetical protein